jgi:hypothetical protein
VAADFEIAFIEIGVQERTELCDLGLANFISVRAIDGGHLHQFCRSNDDLVDRKQYLRFDQRTYRADDLACVVVELIILESSDELGGDFGKRHRRFEC